MFDNGAVCFMWFKFTLDPLFRPPLHSSWNTNQGVRNCGERVHFTCMLVAKASGFI